MDHLRFSSPVVLKIAFCGIGSNTSIPGYHDFFLDYSDSSISVCFRACSLSLYGFGSGILKVHFGVSGEADMVLKTKFLRWSSGLDNERGIERDEETKKELHSRA